MNCGWMPREEWADPIPGSPAVPPMFGDELYELDVCPGWLVRQPEVVEACEAHAAFRHGAFESYHPHATNDLCEAVLVVEQSFNRYQAYRMKQRERARREKGDL